MQSSREDVKLICQSRPFWKTIFADIWIICWSQPSEFLLEEQHLRQRDSKDPKELLVIFGKKKKKKKQQKKTKKKPRGANRKEKHEGREDEMRSEK